MTSLADAAAAVRRAFEGVPRPADLLHPDCRDDGDLVTLAAAAHWTDLTWEDVQGSYAALAFLSPEGFAHFLPAFLLGVLQHPDSDAAVVDSTVWAFLTSLYSADLQPFVRTHWTALDDDQRDAVGMFLSAMEPHQPDAAQARRDWGSERS